MLIFEFSRRASAVAAVAVLALVGVTVPVGAKTYSEVVAFGDSLSDRGVFYALTGDRFPQPPYWQGRFSDGPAAVEVLANGLGLGNNLIDYASGGAMSDFDNGAQPAMHNGVRTQVNQFSAAFGGVADPNALYFVWAGSNDFTYKGFSPAVAANIVSNQTASLTQLYNMGARDFLLPLLPDFGLTPGGLPFAAQLSPFSDYVDGQLNAAYLHLESTLPGATFTIFDTLGNHRALTAQAIVDGFNVTDACFSGFVGVPGTLCADPSKYLYFDNEHPTRFTHQVLGTAMLAAVPEPASMLLMAAGVIALFGLGRRQG